MIQISFHITPVWTKELVSGKTEKWPDNSKLLTEYSVEMKLLSS